MAAPIYSYSWLADAMESREKVTITSPNGTVFTGMVNSIKLDDGSGRGFLVTISGYLGRIYVRAE
jgi:hypothetical protein